MINTFIYKYICVYSFEKNVFKKIYDKNMTYK